MYIIFFIGINLICSKCFSEFMQKLLTKEQGATLFRLCLEKFNIQ